MKRDQNSTKNDLPERVLRPNWGLIFALICLFALWAYAGYVGFEATEAVRPGY